MGLTNHTFSAQASAAAVVKPSFAAYGDSANVFGKVTNTSGECPSINPRTHTPHTVWALKLSTNYSYQGSLDTSSRRRV